MNTTANNQSEILNEGDLKITEIFYSLQGEARHTGVPTVFVRLTGCPMRCVYCDSAYAFNGGERKTIKSIIAEIRSFNTKFVTITGGEPLAQQNCHHLMTSLCDEGYTVSIETGNAIDIKQVDKRVHIVLDIKTPASQEEKNNRYENLEYISSKDQLKFVITDKDDYVWSKRFVIEKRLAQKVEVLFSPVADKLQPTDLAKWILEDQLNVRMQIQLHKHLWGNVAGV